MPSASRKDGRKENETEVFRMYLEKSGTIDALTGWIRKIVESIQADERPSDPVQFLAKNWNPWNSNVLSTAIRNALQLTYDELTKVLLENKRLRERINAFEEILLQRRLDALNLTVAAMKNADSTDMEPTGVRLHENDSYIMIVHE